MGEGEVGGGESTGGGGNMDSMLASISEALSGSLGIEPEREESGSGREARQETSEGATREGAAPPPAPTPSPAPAPAPGTPEAATPPAVTSPAPAPEAEWKRLGFKPETEAAWNAADPALRAEFLRRNDEFHAGMKQFQQRIGEVDSVLAPYMPTFNQYGINPLNHVQTLLGTHHQLVMAPPAQREQMLIQIAGNMGVRLVPANADGEPAYIDPQVETLRAQISELQSARNADIQRQQQAQMEANSRQVAEFAAKSPYFEELHQDILVLIKGGLPLQDAYEKAKWANPTVRAKVRAEEAKVEAEAKAKADAEHARKAAEATAANARPAPRPARETAAAGESVEDTVKNQLALIRKREGRG